MVLSLALMTSACGGGKSTQADTANAIPPAPASQPSPFDETKVLVSDTANRTMDDAMTTVHGPLDDVGIDRDEVPPMLLVLIDDPYHPPGSTNCSALRRELSQIDFLIGPDTDYSQTAGEGDAAGDEESWLAKGAQRGAQAAHDVAVGFVKSKLNLIPFRSVIRYVSGAKKHEKEMAQATEAGRLRRAYLKGLVAAQYGPKCSLGPAITTAGTDGNATDDAPGLEVATKL